MVIKEANNTETQSTPDTSTSDEPKSDQDFNQDVLNVFTKGESEGETTDNTESAVSDDADTSGEGADTTPTETEEEGTETKTDAAPTITFRADGEDHTVSLDEAKGELSKGLHFENSMRELNEQKRVFNEQRDKWDTERRAEVMYEDRIGKESTQIDTEKEKADREAHYAEVAELDPDRAKTLRIQDELRDKVAILDKKLGTVEEERKKERDAHDTRLIRDQSMKFSKEEGLWPSTARALEDAVLYSGTIKNDTELQAEAKRLGDDQRTRVIGVFEKVSQGEVPDYLKDTVAKMSSSIKKRYIEEKTKMGQGKTIGKTSATTGTVSDESETPDLGTGAFDRYVVEHMGERGQ